MDQDHQQKKLRVGVIMGGASSEKEVSLESGRHLWQILDASRFEPIPLFLRSDLTIWKLPIKLVLMNTTKDIEDALDHEARRIRYEELKDYIDFMLLGLHGTYGEDGSMQGLLELLNIPYSGSGVLTSAIGMNKYLTRMIWNVHGIPTPKHMLLDKSMLRSPQDQQELVKRIEAEFTYPLIIKPAAEGCSTGLAKVKSNAELLPALVTALACNGTALVDEYIDALEITTTVIGNDKPYALAPTETPPAFGHDYLTLEDKFLPGGAAMITPARVKPDVLEEIKHVCEQAYNVLGTKGYARIDGFVRNDKVILNEINTLPGATPSTCLIQEAAHEGWTPTEFLSRVIDLGLEAHRTKKGPL